MGCISNSPRGVIAGEYLPIVLLFPVYYIKQSQHLLIPAKVYSNSRLVKTSLATLFLQHRHCKATTSRQTSCGLWISGDNLKCCMVSKFLYNERRILLAIRSFAVDTLSVRVALQIHRVFYNLWNKWFCSRNRIMYKKIVQVKNICQKLVHITRYPKNFLTWQFWMMTLWHIL